MALTVRELTEIPYLRTRLIAGERGADRAIAWAHSIEIPRPWEWLEPGDFLMTVGLGIPAAADEQVEYVESLAGVGVCGVAIGEDMKAPPLTDEMLAAADQLGLPLLITAYEVPFIQVSRAVAAGNSGADHARVVGSMRVYDRARLAVARGSSPSDLLRDLGDDLDCRVYVCENDRGGAPLQGGDPPPPAARDALLAALAERDGTLPGIVRLPLGDGTLLLLPIPVRRPASLLVLPQGTAPPPPFAILQHVATVAALQLERLWATREELRRLGSETFAHLIDRRIAGPAAAAQLQAHGLEQGPFTVLAAARRDQDGSSGWLHHALADRAVPNVLLRRDRTVYCLLPDDEPTVASVTDLLADADGIGVSASFDTLDHVRRATQEARWALDATRIDGNRVVRYGEERSALGPRSIAEAQAVVDRVLGAVIDYDERNEGELVESLAVFLRQNRSWQRAAAELFVHKQTLVYRMGRVEELSGRKLNDTAGVTELWLALEAHERLRSQP